MSDDKIIPEMEEIEIDDMPLDEGRTFENKNIRMVIGGVSATSDTNI